MCRCCAVRVQYMGACSSTCTCACTRIMPTRTTTTTAPRTSAAACCSPWQISQWKYSKAAEHVKEQCIHVLLPGTSECYVSASPLVNVLNPYPRSTSDAAWPTHTKPGGRRQWQRAWESIEAQLVELMLLTREARRNSR